MTALPNPIEPEPIRGTGPAPMAYSVVRVICARLEIAKRIRRDVAALAASDAELDAHVRFWAEQVSTFEARVELATAQARRIAEGGR